MSSKTKQNEKEADPVVRELRLIKEGGNLANELLQDLLITQLGIAGVPQLTIREIVGVNVHRVSRIVKHFKKTTNK